MPLTPSHAAAALPLHRIAPKLPLAALVVATLAPDFEYLLRLAPHGHFGHTPIGFFVFSLPTAYLAYLIFDRIIRPGVVDLLPPAMRSELVGPPAPFGGVVIAIVLGAASHVFWDGFTHELGWGTSLLPFLRTTFVSLGDGRFSLFKILQHGSTVVGALVLIGWGLVSWFRHPAPMRTYLPGGGRRALLITGILLGCGALGAAANALRVRDGTIAEILGFAAVGGMDALAVAGIAWGWSRRTAS